jgi:hypothetical protein
LQYLYPAGESRERRDFRGEGWKALVQQVVYVEAEECPKSCLM